MSTETSTATRPAPVTVDVGALAPEDVVAVARDGAPVELSDAALAAIDRARAVVEELAGGADAGATASRPASARSPPGTSRPRCGPSCSASLVRSHAAGSGPEVEREVVRALMLLRLSTLATGHTGVRRETAQTAWPTCSTPASRRSCTSTARSAAPATWRRSSHCALALMGEGDGARRRPASLRAGRRGARRGRARRRSSSRAKEGLALINGTDGMLGMLVMAIADLRRLLRTADIAAAMSRRGACSAPTGCSPPSCRRSGRTPARRSRRPTCVALLAGLRRRRLATAGRTATGSRTPTRCAARRRCTAPPATPSSTPRPSPAASWPRAVDNPVVLPGRPGRVQRQLPRRPGRLRARLPGDRRRRRRPRSAERRTDRFLDKARNHGLPPFLADDPGVDSGHMIAQYTQAAIVSRAEAARRPGLASTRSRPARCRRTTSRWAGRPRASCAARSTGSTRVLADRGAHRRAGARPARAARARRRRPAPWSRLLRRAASRAPAPTATSARDRDRRRSWSRRAPSSPPSKK